MSGNLRFEDVRVDESSRRDSRLGEEFFNRRFRLLVEAINSLESRLLSIEATNSSLVSLGLARINEVLGPALTKVQQAADLGFLIARSDTEAALPSVGQQITLVVNEDGGRDLFTPTPTVVLNGYVDDALTIVAYGSLISYNAETGAFAANITSISEGSGTPDYWQISAAAQVIPDLTAALAAVAEDAVAVAEDRAFIEGVVTDIEEGPVVSVAGKTGAVALTTADVAGLDTALAGKAAAGHTHTAEQVSGLTTLLNAKAAITHSHTIGDVTGLQTALDGKLAALSDVGATGQAMSNGAGGVRKLVAGQNVTLTQETGGEVTVDVATGATPAASGITFTPYSGIAGSTVQAAIQEVYDESARASHAHAISDVTNLQTAIDAKLSSLSNVGASGQSMISGAGGVRLLKAGSNITLSQQAGGEVTVAASFSASASGVSFSPTGGISATTVQNAIAELDSEKAATSHTHDSRYYTESEVDTLLAAKAASSHTHTKSQITDLPQIVEDVQIGAKYTVAIGASTDSELGDSGYCMSGIKVDSGRLPMSVYYRYMQKKINGSWSAM
jgi:hypothetical protein